MSTAITVFGNDEFGEIRTALINGEPYCMLADVCRVLDLGNTSMVVQRLDQAGVSSIEVSYPSGSKQAYFISESNFYRTVFQSRKPQAEKFVAWVTEEVLPAIRKTGAYISPKVTFIVPKTLAEALELAARLERERERLEIQNKALIDQNLLMAPKAESYDIAIRSDHTWDMATVAQCINVYGFGRNKLMAYLREKKIFGCSNRPYQQYVNDGFFKMEIVPLPPRHKDGKKVLRIYEKPVAYYRGINLVHRTMLADGLIPTGHRVNYPVLNPPQLSLSRA